MDSRKLLDITQQIIDNLSYAECEHILNMDGQKCKQSVRTRITNHNGNYARGSQ